LKMRRCDKFWAGGGGYGYHGHSRGVVQELLVRLMQNWLRIFVGDFFSLGFSSRQILLCTHLKKNSLTLKAVENRHTTIHWYSMQQQHRT
jgi:hypothetical protein